MLQVLIMPDCVGPGATAPVEAGAEEDVKVVGVARMSMQ